MTDRMRESVVERHLKKALEKHGGQALKFVSPSLNGMPDRLCILPGGRMFFVELKAPGGKPRPLQKRRHQQLRDLGVDVFVVDHPNQIEVMLDGRLPPA